MAGGGGLAGSGSGVDASSAESLHKLLSPRSEGSPVDPWLDTGSIVEDLQRQLQSDALSTKELQDLVLQLGQQLQQKERGESHPSRALLIFLIPPMAIFSGDTHMLRHDDLTPLA